MTITLFFLLLLHLLQAAHAVTFQFSEAHGDHMVLQQGPNKTTVWGYGYPGQSVLVTVTPHVTTPSTCTISKERIWQCQIGPVTASMQAYTITAMSRGVSVAIHNVLFGDVWACLGQSNMQFPVDVMFDYERELVEASNFPFIRVFTRTAGAMKTVVQPWSIPSSSALSSGRNWLYFSAICWTYGRALFESLQYPIGLISSTAGGSPIISWSSPTLIASCPASDCAVCAVDVGSDHRNPSVSWGQRVVPLLRTTIKGIIWSQGEADVVCQSHAEAYQRMFPALIDDYRKYWHLLTEGLTHPTFPFGIVGFTSDYRTRTSLCTDDDGNSLACRQATLRWGQTGNYGYVPNARMPATFMAVTTDLGDREITEDFPVVWHARYKREIGQRLAAAAMNVVYSRNDFYHFGPIAELALTNGSVTIVHFRNVGAHGLYIKHPQDRDFEVLVDSKWIPAIIVSNTRMTVSVSYVNAHQSVQAPTRIRYHWRQSPCDVGAGPFNCAIYAQQEQFPAHPFILETQPM